jgi:hypothetical protein
MVLMTIAVGLYLFDGDEHETADSGAAFDLCFGLAITSIAGLAVVCRPCSGPVKPARAENGEEGVVRIYVA